MMVIVRDDDTFAADVRSVATTTVVPTAEGERIVDPGAPPREPGSRSMPLDMEWPANAMFEHAGYLFPVPMAARRLVRRVDTDGVLLRAEFFDGEGRVVSTVSVERDAHGRLTAIVSDAGAEVQLVYDDAHRQVTTAVSLRGIVVSEKRCTVDEHGLVTREEETTMDGTMRTISYVHTLNERSDWIERTAYVDGAAKPAVITRRRIVYRD